MREENISGKFFVIGEMDELDLEDNNHVFFYYIGDQDEILDKLIKTEYDFIVIVDNELAIGKIEAVPEEHRERIIIVSLSEFSSEELTRYEDLGVINFIEKGHLLSFVQRLLKGM